MEYKSPRNNVKADSPSIEHGHHHKYNDNYGYEHDMGKTHSPVSPYGYHDKHKQHVEAINNKRNRRTIRKRLLFTSATLGSLFICLVIAIPVIMTVMGQKDLVIREIDASMSFKIDNMDLQDLNSAERKEFITKFCSQVKSVFNQHSTSTSGTVKACLVEKLSTGSILVDFVLKIGGNFRNPAASDFLEPFRRGKTTDGQVKIGIYTVNANSMEIKNMVLNRSPVEWTTTLAPTTTTTPVPPTMSMADEVFIDNFDTITLSCITNHPPVDWTTVTITSPDGATSVTLNNDQSVSSVPSGKITLEKSTSTNRLTITAKFGKSGTWHCGISNTYTCKMMKHSNILAETSANLTVTASNDRPMMDFNTTNVNEGEALPINCQGEVPDNGGSLKLHVLYPNTTDFVPYAGLPNTTSGPSSMACRSTIASTYSFIPLQENNGTEFKCVISNDFLGMSNGSDVDMVNVKGADFKTVFKLPKATWDPALSDSNTKAFKDLAGKIEKGMDDLFKDSELKDIYVKSKVIGFRNGSIIVISVTQVITTIRIIVDSGNNQVNTQWTANDFKDVFNEEIEKIQSDNKTATDNPLVDVDTEETTVDSINEESQKTFSCRFSKTDIIFLLDRSGSIGSANYIVMKNFISNFTGTIAIGDNAGQIGVVSFASSSRTEFNLNAHNSPGDIIEAVNNMLYTRGGTNIGRGLVYVQENSFSFANKSNGGRHDAKRVLILMTDGKSGDASTQGRALRDETVLIICIGIGSGINQQQLLGIAGNSSYVKHVSFETLIQIKDIVQSSACEDDNNA